MYHENANLWRPFIFDTIELETFNDFSFDQKYESINEYDKKLTHHYGCGSLKHVFWHTVGFVEN